MKSKEALIDELDELRQRVASLEAEGARLRQDGADFEEARNKFEQIADNVNEVIFMFSPDWQRAFYVSPAYEDIWGRPVGDVYGRARAWMEAIVPEDRGRMDAFIDGQARGEVPYENEIDFRIRAPDCAIKWISGRTYPVRDRQGKVYRITGIAEDVTARKAAEERLKDSEKFLNNIFDCFQDGISILDRDLNIVRVNHVMEEWHPYMMPLCGKKCYYVYHERSEPCELCPSIRAIEAGTAQSDVIPFHGKDGLLRGWLELFAYPLTDDRGEVVGVIEHVRDITARKRAEDALRDSEEKYRSLVENINDMVWEMDKDFRITYASSRSRDLLGYEAEELVGRQLFSLILPADLDAFGSAIEEAYRARGPIELAGYRARRRDGQIVYLETNSLPVFDGEGGFLGYRGVSRDITERRRADEALASERSQLMSIFDSIDEVVYVTDPYTYEVLYANKAMREMFGGDLVGATCYRKFQRKDSPCDFCTNVIILREKGKPYRWEYYNPTVGRHFMITDRIIKWPDGRDVRFEIAKDITERKEAEEALRESESRLSMAQEAGHVGVFDWDLTTNRAVWTPELEDIFGIPHGQFENVYDDWAQRVHPEDLQRVERLFQEWMRSGRDRDEWEYRFVRDGETRWISARGRIFYDPEGRPRRMIGTNLDITERKEAEESLQLVQHVIDQAQDEASLAGPDGRFCYVNDAKCRSLGYTREELLAMSVWDVDPDMSAETWPAAWKGIKEKGFNKFETRHRARDGRTFPTEVWLTYISFHGREYVCAFVRDISDRKRAEKSLNLTQFTMDRTGDMVLWVAPDSRFIYVNQAACRTFGYTREEMLALTAFDTRPSWTEQSWAEHWREIKERGSFTFEASLRKKDGSYFPAEISVNYLVYEGKEYNCSVVREITDRKRAEEALQESERKFRALAESAGAGILLYRHRRVLYVNPTMEKITGYSKDELMSMDFWRTVHPDFQEVVRSRGIARQRGAPVPSTYEFQIVTKGGEVRWVELSAAMIDYEGRPTVLATVFDITGRKRAEAELQEAKSEAELYLDLMGHDIRNMNQISIGFLEMALETLKPDGDSVDLIARPLEAMFASTRLIENVRKLRMINEGGLKFHEIEVGKMIAGIAPRYSGAAGREVKINCTSSCECRVVANDLLDDVFSNIIGNAIKHSRGPLTIDVHMNKVVVGGRKYCLVAIEDDGPGIPDDLKDELFSRFTGKKRRKSGHGLGLYLVGTLMEDFHGRVWVEDRVKGDYARGSRFMVLLPAADA